MKLIFTFLLIVSVHCVLVAQWEQVNNGLTASDNFALAADATNLFVGTTAGGVFRSTDHGVNWTEVNTGLTNTNVRSLKINGSNVFAGTLGGVFVSTNNGASWTAVNSGLTNSSVYALAVIGSNLFAGTAGGVFRTTNNGGSWAAVNSGLTTTTVNALGVNGTILFAGTDGGGAFRSTNNGASWTQINTGLTNVYVVSFALSGSNVFAGTWGGVNRSANNGTNWTGVNTGLPAFANVRALTVSGSNLFAGVFGGGVYFTTDQGANWTVANAGLASSSVRALAVCGTYIFTATADAGVFRRTMENILPVQISMFSAYPVPHGVRLEWTTLSEINNYGFEVQKSSSAHEGYVTLPNSFIPGHGTTNEPRHYTWTDSTATAGSWYYRLKQIDLDGTVHYSDGIRVDVLTSLKEGYPPAAFYLSQNFPNPWNPSTTIRYSLPERSYVKLTICNTLGQQVVELVNGQQAAGTYDVVFNGEGLASGMYLCRLSAGKAAGRGRDFIATRRLVLLR